MATPSPKLMDLLAAIKTERDVEQAKLAPLSGEAAVRQEGIVTGLNLAIQRVLQAMKGA